MLTVCTNTVPLGIVTFVWTVCTPILSVAVTLQTIVWVRLASLGEQPKLTTEGEETSLTVKFVFSVSFSAPAVSFAIIVTLYLPWAAVFFEPRLAKALLLLRLFFPKDETLLHFYNQQDQLLFL